MIVSLTAIANSGCSCVTDNCRGYYIILHILIGGLVVQSSECLLTVLAPLLNFGITRIPFILCL